MAITTIASNDKHLWSYFYKMTLAVTTQQRVFVDIGDDMPLPKKHGTQMIWTKVKRLPTISSPTTPGTPPTPRAITSARITAEVSQYKDAISFDEGWDVTNANEDIRKTLEERVSEQMARSLDVITQDQLTTAIGTTQYSNGRSALSALASSDTLTLGDVRKAKLALAANDVGPHKSGYYVFVGHPNTIYDMKTDVSSNANWVDVHKYTDAGFKKLFNAEVGETDQIKFKETTLISKSNSGTSGSAYAYTQFMFGYQPFGTVKLNAASVKLIFKDFGSAGTADPVDEIATLGWKAWYTSQYFGNISDVSDPDRAIKLISGRSA